MEKRKFRRDTNPTCKLVNISRSRLYHALKSRSKPSASINILGTDIETYKRWISFQMSPEMNWSNNHIDHVKPFCLFDLSKHEELKEAFRWENTMPLLIEDNLKKGNKYNELDYRLQFFKAYQFIKLNEEIKIKI